MKLRLLCLVVITLITSCTSRQTNSVNQPTAKTNITNKSIEAIGRSRITIITVKCLAFDGSIKDIKLAVMDVLSEEVESIFKDLLVKRFPIYSACCFAARRTVDSYWISMHAYGAAIDINYIMNPYFNVIHNIMTPGRLKDIEKDKENIRKGLSQIRLSDSEIDAILKVAIQPEESDDRFLLNRENLRKGMVTPEVVAIFAKHGFNDWGGAWKERRVDYMHFQIPRPLGKELATEPDINKRKKLWKDHVSKCSI